MYALTNEQIASIPLDSDTDHPIVSRLIRLATTSKRKEYPQLWGESTEGKPVVNLRYLKNGIITGGELSFYYDDWFVTVGYDREHAANIDRFKVTAGDGRYYINHIWIGRSPVHHHRMRIPQWRYNRSAADWLTFMNSWRNVKEQLY